MKRWQVGDTLINLSNAPVDAVSYVGHGVPLQTNLRLAHSPRPAITTNFERPRHFLAAHRPRG
jgi:hypothetical protein